MIYVSARYLCVFKTYDYRQSFLHKNWQEMYQHEILSEPCSVFSMVEMLETLDRHNEVANGYVMCKHSRIW